MISSPSAFLVLAAPVGRALRWDNLSGSALPCSLNLALEFPARAGFGCRVASSMARLNLFRRRPWPHPLHWGAEPSSLRPILCVEASGKEYPFYGSLKCRRCTSWLRWPDATLLGSMPRADRNLYVNALGVEYPSWCATSLTATPSLSNATACINFACRNQTDGAIPVSSLNKRSTVFLLALADLTHSATELTPATSRSARLTMTRNLESAGTGSDKGVRDAIRTVVNVTLVT